MRRPVQRAQGPAGGTGQGQQGRGAAGLGHSLSWLPHSLHSPEAWNQPAFCILWPESTPSQAGGGSREWEVDSHLCARPGARPPEDHRAAAPGYWWGWVRSGAWTLGAQNPSPCPGTSRGKGQGQRARWKAAPGGAGVVDAGRAGLSPLLGGGDRSGCPALPPTLGGFRCWASWGFPGGSARVGSVGRGPSGPGPHPAAPSGGEDKVLGASGGALTAPHPQAPCAQLFLSPPCLKAVKAQSAAGVSVQVGRSPEAPEAAPHPGLPDSSPGPPQALPQPLFQRPLPWALPQPPSPGPSPGLSGSVPALPTPHPSPLIPLLPHLGAKAVAGPRPLRGGRAVAGWGPPPASPHHTAPPPPSGPIPLRGGPSHPCSLTLTPPPHPAVPTPVLHSPVSF